MSDLYEQGLTAQRIAEKNNERSRHEEMMRAMGKSPGLNIQNTVVMPPGAMDELIKAVRSALEKLDIKLPDLEFPKDISVNNLNQLHTVLALIYKELQTNKPVTPNIKVDSPVVNVDTKELAKKLDQVLKAVKAIKVEIPETVIPDFPSFQTDKDGFLLTTVTNMTSGGGGYNTNASLLDKYKAADLDDDASPNYYGFLAPDRDWYILKEDTTAKTYRYVSGSGGYAAAWDARATQDYVLLSEAF